MGDWAGAGEGGIMGIDKDSLAERLTVHLCVAI